MVTDIEINLIEGLKEQSPKAQQMMVERYGRHVFSQVVRLLPSVEDAEEVYQDVFLKVFLNINMYPLAELNQRMLNPSYRFSIY